jgi:PadR family transcriptional regulator PadR
VAKFEGLGALSTGENTLYPLLRRLKGEGYLETYAVESASGPTRQYYRVTNDGRARLKRLETEWKSMADAVARCIKKDSQP